MRSKRRIFTKSDDAFVCAHYGTMPHRDIARRLGWRLIALRKRACKLHVTKPLKRWDASEDEIIRSGHGKKQLQEIARTLGRSISEVSSRCRKIGIARWRVRSGLHGGRPIDGFRPGAGPIFTHRRVIEESIGRRLRSDEIVHHIDNNKFNNAAANLYLFSSRSSHRKAHMSLEKIVPDLMERGIVIFDSTKGVYRLCETNRWRLICKDGRDSPVV